MIIENIDHGRYQARIREWTEAQLRWAIKDCTQAIAAIPDGPKTGYYADEIHYCAAELRRRKTN